MFRGAAFFVDTVYNSQHNTWKKLIKNKSISFTMLLHQHQHQHQHYHHQHHHHHFAAIIQDNLH